jgi:hypothetical protein
MAKIGQDGKEQIFPWATQGALLQGIPGFMSTEKFNHGFRYQTITELLGEVYCIVETDEDIRKQVLLGARERACKNHLMGMHNRLLFPLDIGCDANAQISVGIRLLSHGTAPAQHRGETSRVH